MLRAGAADGTAAALAAAGIFADETRPPAAGAAKRPLMPQ